MSDRAAEADQAARKGLTSVSSIGGGQEVRPPVIVVGAGVAGLVCAIELIKAGQDVLVLEASDGVGGRIRSDWHDGYIFDRGFQVVLDAYPALRRHVEIERLDVGAFDNGALLWTGSRLVPLADPFRHPGNLLRDLTTRIIPFSDKLRLGAWAAKTLAARWETAADAAGDPATDITSEEALWEQGFSRAFVERFARPFWGGISLDPSLSTSAGELRFTFKMFLQGRAVLPAQGMQALPNLLHAQLPMGTVRLNHPVEGIEISDGRVTGVRARGSVIPASAVVVAADGPSARKLTGIERLPREDESVGCVTVYLSGKRNPELGKRLVLDSTGRLTINQIAPISTVQPTYAPSGRYLISAQIIGEAAANPDDEALAWHARQDTVRILGHAPDDWRVRKVVRVPFSQFAQPPGIYGRLPGITTDVEGLFLAGEAVVDSSCNGAMTSGERAANVVLAALKRHAPARRY